MTGSTEPTDLGPITRALQDRPSFLAGWLPAASAADQRVKTRLGLNDEQLQRLLLCRTPRPDHFRADVTAIANYIGIEASALAAALREAAVTSALRQRVPSADADADTEVESDGLLAAARDTAAEQLPTAQASTAVRGLAAATWQAAPPEVRERRDVQSAVVWASPAMVVLLPRLAVATANRWLADHGVPRVADGTGALRGLLVAWRGQAAIFVDGTLAEDERRLTIAHEHGHLLLDYLAPRHRVVREAPDLLEVVDGYRAPTDADRARAALARVPLGLHTHLLARDDRGGAPETTIDAEEDATVYALELLAPLDDVLARVRPLLADHRTYHDRLTTATAELARAFMIPADAAAARAAGALAALGVRQGFFDR